MPLRTRSEPLRKRALVLIPPRPDSFYHPPASETESFHHCLNMDFSVTVIGTILTIHGLVDLFCLGLICLRATKVDERHQDTLLRMLAPPHILEALGVGIAVLFARLDTVTANVPTGGESIVVGVVPVLPYGGLGNLAELEEVRVQKWALRDVESR